MFADTSRCGAALRGNVLRIIGVICLAEFVAGVIVDRLLIAPPGWRRALLDVIFVAACAGPYLCVLSRAELRRRMAAEGEVQRQAQSQAALYKIARLSFMDMSLEDVLGGVLDCLFSVNWLGLDQHGAVFLAEAKDHHLYLRAYRGDDPDLDACTRVFFGQCICGRAAEKGNVEFGSSQDAEHQRRFPGASAHCHYAVPIMLGERCLGVLQLQLRAAAARDERAEEFLETAGDLAALILARKNAESELDRLATAIEQVSEAVFITDPDGSIRYVNPAFTALTGYCREDVIGKNPRILKSGRHGPELYEVMWRTISTGRVWDGRLTDKRKDGVLYEADITVTPIKDDSGRIINFAAVCRDVTAVAALEEKLRRSQKMEAVGLLAGGIAHDFNNVLTTIVGYNYFILEGLETGNSLRPYSLEIKRSAELAGSLTHQLLALGSHQVVQPRVMDANSVILSMTKMLRRLVGEDIDVELSAHSALWAVKMDSGQLEQVVLNLAVNARDAMPKGGRLNLSTKNISARKDRSPDPLISLPAGQYVCLEISDSGMGMDEATRARIFEPFFTTKEPGRGTGLGLSTVMGIVKQYRGHISVQSEPGQGSTFRVYIPRAEGGVEAMLPGDIPKSTKGGEETILVVEDNDALRDIIKKALREKGYRVFSARSAEEALAKCCKLKERIDLLLTDVVLPDVEGPELAKRLLESRPALRVVIMSGYPGGAFAKFSAGRDTFHIEKPFSPEQLLATVRRSLDAAQVEMF
jgi:PAS domain S-box-containing protein